jgi:hypothetical protein
VYDRKLELFKDIGDSGRQILLTYSIFAHLPISIAL